MESVPLSLQYTILTTLLIRDREGVNDEQVVRFEDWMFAIAMVCKCWFGIVSMAIGSAPNMCYAPSQTIRSILRGEQRAWSLFNNIKHINLNTIEQSYDLIELLDPHYAFDEIGDKYGNDEIYDSDEEEMRRIEDTEYDTDADDSFASEAEDHNSISNGAKRKALKKM
ncbi:hypothetical protein SAMD00019534_097670 [Acytostelium subglobosum LB1]|uniref:hypothetical protein n=1 Tax=Acytostelium subglobosum LB1 TaxID=1410327 RepID=UPI0006452268|nr:hypothetical protein SAMD00019534_097670 [Acytostelium subglobosum LB1]GAM26592.1 hypothetical protein SAMD00019534_097670 [Acytostelium subglobosum LB1]|eukprot:XP_012750253.1 hypothetical protein SAMD00019534_097670 [Acytostelium subglobosum LB1]